MEKDCRGQIRGSPFIGDFMAEIQLVHADTLSCETIFRVAPNGDFIIIAQCGGLSEPAPGNRTLLFRSTDEGRTWLAPVDILPSESRAVYCTEVFVFQDRMEAYLTVHEGKFCNFETVIATSPDSGYSWTIRKNTFTEDFCFMRSGLILSDGRYMTVAQHYPGTAAENGALAEAGEYIWKANCEYAENTVVYEDAVGRQTAGGSVRIPTVYGGVRRWKWSEPTVVELEQGHLIMLLRFQGTGHLWRSDSYDFGVTWSKIVCTELENPGNKPKLIKSGNRIVLLNTFRQGMRYNDRNPLSVWVSYDGMNSWGKKIVAVDFPGWLSYPDGICHSGEVLFAFEFNRHDVYFVRAKL